MFDIKYINRIHKFENYLFDGLSPSEFIRSECMKLRNINKIPGGLADKAKPEDFDQEQLQKGIKVELEHTNDKNIATEIAMDHLTEDPNYYKKLSKIEKQ